MNIIEHLLQSDRRENRVRLAKRRDIENKLGGRAYTVQGTVYFDVIAKDAVDASKKGRELIKKLSAKSGKNSVVRFNRVDRTY